MNLKKLSFLFLIGLIHSVSTAESVQPFQLDPLRDAAPFNSSEVKETIIVLDFFAHWCKPCLKLTPKLESEISDYYQSKGGNPAGIAVQVVPVNVDSSSAAKTLRFLDRTGLTHAWQDSDGSVFEMIGQNRGLPFIAVLDLSSPIGDGDSMSLLYEQAGEPDWDVLRRVIDSIQVEVSE